MSELFDNTKETLSPKEKWVRDNKITVTFREDKDGDKWTAHAPQDIEPVVSRDSRDDALARLAQRLWIGFKIKVWGQQ